MFCSFFHFVLVPSIPLPEAPINAIDCRINLLSHIQDMQNEIDSRLETLGNLLEGIIRNTYLKQFLKKLLFPVLQRM